MRHFPRHQIKILRLEDYSQHQNVTINEVYTFLGLPILDDEIFESTVTKSNVANHNIGHMMSKTATLLTEFFEHSNVMLAELLEDTGFLWSEPKQ